MKREAVSHTKMKRLCRALDVPLYEAVGLLELLWHTTSRQAPRGDIGRISDDDIALSMDYREDASILIAAITDSGWIDRNNEHRLIIHDWPDHAEDGVHMKLARAKQFFVCADPKDPSKTLLFAPRLYKLPSKDHAVAAEFYRAHVIPPADPRRAHALRTDGLFVRTDGLFVRTDDARRAHGVRRPRLDPALTPPLKTAAVDKSTSTAQQQPKMQFSEWPLATAAICSPFPATTPVFCGKIIQASVQAFLSVDSAKIPAPDDALLAAAIKAALEQSNGLNSSALLLEKVPAVISNWARFGRNGASNGIPAEYSDPNRYKLGD
jgi:hypothetical protein